jgi:hypothetical protein
MTEAEKREALAIKWAKAKHPKLTTRPLEPTTPAPRLEAVVQARGPAAIADALRAWDARLNGEPLVNVAHTFGLSIEAAKQLIREAHAAIAEDLKEAVNQNRELDLQRTDMILKSFLPGAKEGDRDCASIVLKALGHRSRLTGTEPPSPNQTRPEAILVWIQQQLPAINKIVDALPRELEP